MAFVNAAGAAVGARTAAGAAATKVRCVPASRRATRASVHMAAGDPAANLTDFAGVFDEILPANTDFARKFTARRNAEVRPVSETLKAFFKEFARPLPPVYASIVNETLTTTHLSVVHYAFTYDALFAFGFDESFNRFLQFYPSETEREKLFQSMMLALQLDAKKLRADAVSVRNWLAQGKKLEDVMALADGSVDDGSPVAAAFRTARTNDRMSFHVSRMFALGVFFLLEGVTEIPSHEQMQQLAAKLDISVFPLTDAMDQCRAGMEKLKAAEQLFAEVAARDKKKLAERLAEKARLAEEAAKKAESEAGVTPVSQPASSS